ncbi:hypothetical protein GCM10025794_33950 [Massilia kyonggiensis]
MLIESGGASSPYMQMYMYEDSWELRDPARLLLTQDSITATFEKTQFCSKKLDPRRNASSPKP